MIAALVSGLITLFTQGGKAAIEDIKESREQERELRRAEMENKARMLRDSQADNHEWEMANLTDKDKWLRRGSYIMFSAPFIWAFIDPAGVEQYFAVALTSMPDWYVKTYVGMVGGIWGIAQLKNSIPGIINGVKKAVSK